MPPVAMSSEADIAAQANNPLANMKAFNMHNYYIGDLTESDESANQFWMRYAQPFSIGESNWLMHASLPVNSFPTPPDSSRETGIGDFRCQPWRAKRRLVDPSSREAALLTRRAHSARGEAK